MQQGYLQAYAIYFSKYVQAYKQNGINIQMIMPQNEIAWTPWLAFLYLASGRLGYFCQSVSWAQFEKDSIDTEIWMGTVNYPNPGYVRTFSSRKILINM